MKIEFELFKKTCHIYILIGYGEIRFSIAIPFLFAFWLTINSIKIQKLFGDNQKEIGISISHWGIWWNLFTSTMSWNAKTPKYRNGCFKVKWQ